MKNVVVLNDEAHHCYRERERPGEDRGGPEGRGQGRGQEQQRGGPAVDLRARGGQAQARPVARLRPVGHAVLPARLRLCRGHAVPLDHERLLADGRHRMRHRQAAARARRRQSRAATCPVTAICGSTSARMPKKGRGKAGARPAEACRRSCRRRSKRSTATTRRPSSSGRRRHRCPAGLHRGVQQHLDSKLVYDYISGFHRDNDDGTSTLENGRLELFRNYDDTAIRCPPQHAPDRLRAARVGRALDKDFREMAADEIERFRREIIQRTGDIHAGDKIDDQDLLREVMNTVGKKAGSASRSAASSRCPC
jgi:type III restriction enzyme